MLACASLAEAHEGMVREDTTSRSWVMPETWRLLGSINAWWTEIEVFLTTGVTNARTEGANTSIKQLKSPCRATETPDITNHGSSCAAPARRTLMSTGLSARHHA